jgi:formamidopyrimidine-DNA glycosylase
MPELPEVETMRRGIRSIVGCVVEEVVWPKCKLKPIEITPGPRSFRRRVLGREVHGLDRLGKRVLVRFNGGENIVFEPRMTGLLLLADPPDSEHLRFCLKLRGSEPCLWFWDRRGLGSVRCLNQSELKERFGSGKLGPDALVVTPLELKERLGTSTRAVKVALLDQRAVAGIGNLYASEILHVAGIHPDKQCNRLSLDGWKAIQHAVEYVLREAIHYEGSTLADGTYRNALNQNGSYQNHHRVYNRHGKSCPRCRGTKIRRIVQAQRSTFFCPGCQKKRVGRRTPT